MRSVLAVFSRLRKPWWGRRGFGWLLLALVVVLAAVTVVAQVAAAGGSRAGTGPVVAGVAPSRQVPAPTTVAPSTRSASGGQSAGAGHGSAAHSGPGHGGAGSARVLLRWGDTLWVVSRRCHTSVVGLQRRNGLGSSTLIRAGTRLMVPSGCGAAGARAEVVLVTRPAVGVAAVIGYARAQLRKPYRFGAAGPDAFDCSGLVMRAWQTAGVRLPHLAAAQARYGVRVSRRVLQPGDLIFTHGFGHVELYIGAGQVIYAPHPGALVKQSSLPPPGQVDAYGHLTPHTAAGR